MAVVIKGAVSIKVHGLLKHKNIPGLYAVLYDGGGGEKLPRIEMFEDKNDRLPVHTIHLEHLKFSDKSYRQHDSNLVLSIKKDKHSFLFGRWEDKDDWVKSLCHVSTQLWKQFASTQESSDFDETEKSEDMSDNLLYDSCDKVQQFKVSIIPTRASKANNLEGHFFLNPTKDSLRLLDTKNFCSLHEWPYRQIRKYGRTRSNFRMEVGRNVTTGEGEFEFFTPEGSRLTELLTAYTTQARAEDKRAQEEDAHPSAAVPPRPAVDPPTPSPQLPAPPAIPRRESEHSNRTSDPGSRNSQSQAPRGASFTAPPRPTPRTNPPPVPKPESGIAQLPLSASSGDTKIYETSCGLTAPLDSQLKNELHTKLRVSDPDPEPDNNSSEEPSSLDYTEEDKGAVEGVGGGQGAREKQLSGKDKKKQEKAEAKLIKQQEKDQKEREKVREKEEKAQKEKEAKEQKKLKKEKLKSLSKGSSKKSLTVQLPEPDNEQSANNIYDEPGELLVNKAPPPPPEGPSYAEECAYAEADVGLAKAAYRPKPPAAEPREVEGDVYSMPVKPKKDSWKQHAIPESEDYHQENYDEIKLASLSSKQPDVHPRLRVSNSLPSASEVDDTYNRLCDIQRSTVHEVAPENIYGMASAVETMQAGQTDDGAGANVYEDADTICNVSRPRNVSQQPSDQYEEADLQSVQRPPASLRNVTGDTGDYVDVELDK